MSTVNPQISAWGISNFGFFPALRVVFELITVIFWRTSLSSFSTPRYFKSYGVEEQRRVLTWGSTVLNLVLQKEKPQMPGCW